MRLLVIGSGGREHALAWKLSREKATHEVFLAPGNPGMALEPKVTCTGISAGDFPAIAKFCRERKVDFVVVGPDQALADGAVDFLEGAGIPAFGPKKKAAHIEASKGYAKELMKSAGIPTARYGLFSDLPFAKGFIQREEWGSGWVVKADGLALGKGVVVCETREEALGVIHSFLGERTLGDAGDAVVIEERLIGREVSGFFFCDGIDSRPLGFACDHKRIFDGDKGPNTGGMGAYSPAAWLPEGFAEQVTAEIVRPLLKAMRAEKNEFRGMLFVGLMVTAAGPKVIEFNARFGDPETQVLMPMLNEDLLPWLRACREGTLQAMPERGPAMKPGAGVHVVMAAEGYPGTPKKGAQISIPEELLPQEDESERMAKLFFAGVARTPEMNFATNGGRVLGLTALGADLPEARRKAYELISTVSFAGAQYRSDIAK